MKVAIGNFVLKAKIKIEVIENKNLKLSNK